jgi:thiosulfate dehydrogenase [quinone] large subunit
MLGGDHATNVYGRCAVLYSFLESLSYRGFLWPVALLRVYLGWTFLGSFVQRWQSGFFQDSSHVWELFAYSKSHAATSWFTENLWQWAEAAPSIVLWVFYGAELVLGLSYFLGWFVRPVSILGFLLCLSHLTLTTEIYHFQYELLAMVHLFLLLIGGGRCLGLDYHFYRHQRGLWW